MIRPLTKAIVGQECWGFVAALAGVLVAALVFYAEGAAGDLDPTFGAGGKVFTDFGGDFFASSLVQQPDGKLVVAGMFDDGCWRLGMARYHPNGSLDTTFGMSGKVLGMSGGCGGAGAELVLQPDGKLVVALDDFNDDIYVARYNPDGSLDASFGTGGEVVVESNLAEVHDLIRQPDGKLVVAGADVFEGTQYDIVLVRLNPDGSLDGSFGTAGQATIDLGGIEIAGSVVSQPDGKLMVACNTSKAALLLARVNSDGSLDAIFADTVDSIDGNLRPDLIRQPDGKFVVSATGFAGFADDFEFPLILRFNPNGTTDDGFGADGRVALDFGSPEEYPSALVRQSDGKIVMAGTAFPGVDIILARLNPNGSLDAGFGTNGKVVTDFGGREDASAAVVQPDGKIVVAGSHDGDLLLARYLSVGATAVKIDINPGSSPNSINPKSNGVIPVAILTTDTFDATTIDPLSVRFGPKGAKEAHNKGHIEDVNHDGEPDLVLHFKTQATGIRCGDTSAALTGETFDRDLIQGSDAIKTVGCNKSNSR
jgi:uncharacterized delta-60 repeat protein